MGMSAHSCPPEKSALRGRSFRLLLVTTIGAFAGYVLLLPVVPLWAVAGGAGTLAAGATNGVFMLVTVVTQLAMPRLLRCMGPRRALALGALLIGAPTPLFAASTELWVLLGVSGLRGVGFGLLTVAGGALVAELVPASQLGRATGFYGLAVGLPNVAFLPLGVWLTQQIGFVVLFWVAAGTPIVAALAALGMESVRARTSSDPSARSFPLTLLPPWLMMTAVSISAGGFVAFLPLAVAPTVAPPALMAFGFAVVAGRWAAGVIGDRLGSQRVLLPALLTAGAGAAGVAFAIAGPVGPAVVGAFGLGGGFGALQNATLVVMFERARSGPASTAWNVAYDAGNGIGAVGFGVLVTTVDYPLTFLLAAGLIACCAPLAAWRVVAREHFAHR